MAILSRDEILASAGKLKRETVNVPELGGEVIVRELSAGDRDQYEMLLYDKRKAGDKKDHLRAALAVFSLVNDNGDRLFDEQDIPALAALSSSALDRVFDVSRRLSALDAVEVEKQAKN